MAIVLIPLNTPNLDRTRIARGYERSRGLSTDLAVFGERRVLIPRGLQTFGASN